MVLGVITGVICKR